MSLGNTPLRAGAWRIAPFAGACVLTWVAVLVGSSIHWWEYATSVVVALLAGLLALGSSGSRRYGWVGVVPSALLLLAAVGLVRDAAGGFTSGAGALAILPVFQTALYSRSRRDLGIVLAGVALFYLVPILLIGAPAYPNTQYRATLLAVAVDAIIGLATQGLVARVRQQAADAGRRERMLGQVTNVVHGLFDSPHPRTDVCHAARNIGHASVVLLFEPAAGSDQLVCTAAAGVDAPIEQVTADQGSAIYEAVASRAPQMITKNVVAHIAVTELWIASGRPNAVLYQPLLRGDSCLGVLVVGWPGGVRGEGPEATVVALLAHEAAAVIARADAMDHLNDVALTDALTGLPNRRAWEAHLTHAVDTNDPLALAIIDFDHFKEFNDTHGHPAGDRLLKETAAAWRDQLRTGDFLARIGGEEFGLLLPNCNAQIATDVIGRLRHTVTNHRTCSAGLATRQPRETAQSMIARADHALYQAKAQGRNRLHVSTSA